MEDNERKPERKQSRLYTTKIINELYEDMQMGFVVDKEPFYPFDTELRNANVTFSMTPEEEEEYMHCFNDANYFIEKYCKFMTDAGRRTVKLRDYQIDTVSTITSEHLDETIGDEGGEFVPDNRVVMLMWARQCSKTTTTAAYITWYICFHTDRNVGIMANKEDTAKEIVDKTQEMIKGLPFFLQPGVRKWGAKGAKFDNGCAIISSATTKTASIGFTMNGILYLDEFAHIDQNICYDFWRSVYPTLSSSKTAQLIISSTPNGTEHNKFYDLWSGDNDDVIKKIRVDYWQVPGHDDAWAEEQKRIFGEEEFNQEFLLQFSATSRALLKGRSLQFTLGLCEHLGNYKPTTLPYEKYLDDEKLEWVKGFNPNSISKNDFFVIILDLSDGKGDDDESKKKNAKTPDSNTIQIYKAVMNSPQNVLKYKSDGGISVKDAYRYIQVGRWESNEKDEKYCGYLTSAIALDLFNSESNDNVRIMMEMNFNGKSCLSCIQNHPKYYDNLVLKTYHTTPIPGEKTRTKKYYGFKTGAEKDYYCKEGVKMVFKKRIVITDMKTYNQLKSFGYDHGTIKGIACHDDLSYPALNHIPRMLNETDYVDWLEEKFENDINNQRKYELNNIIKLYEMDDPNSINNDIDNFYDGISDKYNVMPNNNYYGGSNNNGGSFSSLFGNRY